jgi:hypothetical protein
MKYAIDFLFGDSYEINDIFLKHGYLVYLPYL